MMNYGIPYKGSKNKIATWIVEHLPANDNLYDLFAGGCAVTHAALLSGKFKHIVVNDIRGQYPKCFVDAANGKYKNEHRVITRDEFHPLRDSDPYIATCWSFGNDCKSYLIGEQNEKLMLEALRMIMAETWQERRRLYMNFVKIAKNGMPSRCDLRPLESLERLQSIEKLKGIQKLEVGNASYSDVDILPNSTVYCDIPYKGTYRYNAEFDYDKFYDWCLSRDYPIFVSEYAMPDDFVPIAEKTKICTAARTSNNIKTIEKIFIQRKFAEKFK